MRKGFAIKVAIDTTLRKTWAAAGVTGIPLGNLKTTFQGQGACVRETGVDQKGRKNVWVNLPDFLDAHAYADDHADRIVAYALHELGHVLFTVRLPWDRAVQRAPLVVQERLSRCINVFEDVRMERQVITSGVAAGADRLFKQLLRHVCDKADPRTFELIDNVPMAIRINGSNYGIDVLGNVPEKWKGIAVEGIAKCAGLKTTDDSVAAGRWLYEKLKQGEAKQPPPPPPEDGEGGEGEQRRLQVGDKVRCPDGSKGIVTAIHGDEADVKPV